MRIIFAGTPEIAAIHLNTLIHSEHEVCAVYTQPDRPAGRGRRLMPSPVKQLALEHQLPVHQPISLRRDIAARDTLKSYQPDLMVVVAYGLILPQDVLNMPRYGCFNVHASLLPRWRGAAPIQYAILSGDKKTGVTIMQMDSGLDTGNILYKLACDIDTNETSSTLHDKLCEFGPKALLTTIDLLTKNKLQPEKQNDAESTYAHKIKKEQAQIDWQQSANEIDRMIRAFNPWPVAFTHYDEQVIRIWDAKVKSEVISNEAPGTVLNLDKKHIEVATGEGVLTISEMQLPGSKRMSVVDILNGKKINFTNDSVFR